LYWHTPAIAEVSVNWMWDALPYVGSGLSLAAFLLAAILLVRRAYLTRIAGTIKSAPEEAAAFLRLGISGFTDVQLQVIALAQIRARTRRDLVAACTTLAIAIPLAVIAVLAILPEPGCTREGFGNSSASRDPSQDERSPRP
jgi:hypothetical protein